jgi:hypothetical protein
LDFFPSTDTLNLRQLPGALSRLDDYRKSFSNWKINISQENAACAIFNQNIYLTLNVHQNQLFTLSSCNKEVITGLEEIPLFFFLTQMSQNSSVLCVVPRYVV